MQVPFFEGLLSGECGANVEQMWAKKPNKKTQPTDILLIAFFKSRGGKIRTCDLLLPKQAR